jgi:hypothetical protein
MNSWWRENVPGNQKKHRSYADCWHSIIWGFDQNERIRGTKQSSQIGNPRGVKRSRAYVTKIITARASGNHGVTMFETIYRQTLTGNASSRRGVDCTGDLLQKLGFRFCITAYF